MCGDWSLAHVPDDFHSRLDTTVPILSMTGELDPSMPPAWGAELAAALPEARHLTIPDAPHGLLGMRGVGCVVELIEGLIVQGSARDLDATCLTQVERPPFALP